MPSLQIHRCNSPSLSCPVLHQLRILTVLSKGVPLQNASGTFDCSTSMSDAAEVRLHCLHALLYGSPHLGRNLCRSHVKDTFSHSFSQVHGRGTAPIVLSYANFSPDDQAASTPLR